MKITFKIHPITYLILLSVLLCGMFNYFLIISTILITHDLGHILTMKRFKITINEIIILPFGSIIISNIKHNINSLKLLLISISGILFQLILIIIVNILFNNGIINNISLDIFNKYNKLIILFNLLPIIPLDGSKILLSINELFIPYKKCLNINNIISIILIIIFTIKNNLNLNLILIISYLLIKTIIEIKNHNYIFNNFLLERYLIKPKFKKIKYINNIKNIYKNKYNFINNISEEKYLNKKFSYY